ncbi:ABC transporter ATP-binding protein [Paenibacillus lupini]|uniref:ABC transporter ATP-binding protein n=1 Tax=Paenibacillus lupini TaxID=1450204 RepID=UPI00142364F5|nr:ABC transporter ATP-binding protein [Paenibacillus lupini]NIK21829.1 ABC-2 type transport system ATP-binding protein [Paenibacillus lupini]
MSVLLSVEQLTKRFDEELAVDNIGFEIGEGRCVALLGPNGAGKTTTIRMLTGLLQPTSGTIQFSGMKQGQDRREWIGYLPQTPAFYGWMTGREFLVYAGRLCGLSAKEAASRSNELLERVGIASAGKRKIGGYSGGMKQRLGLAQALIHRPRLLVLDEPVSALDPIGRREVMAMIGELKNETTVLFSTHVLHDAEELCDDILIMRRGQLSLAGSLATLREENREPVLSLEIEEDDHSRQWLAGWINKLPNGILATSETRGSVRLIAQDLETARRAVLKELTKSEVSLSKLEIGHSTLEDLFLKVVTAP